jgi:hypothetical protein
MAHSIAIAVGIIGVVAIVRRLFFRRRFGHGAPWMLAACGGPEVALAGTHGCGGRGRHFGAFRSRFGQSLWLRRLFSRLDTTPGQEREIRSALEDFQNLALDARKGLGESRADIARAMTGDTFDDDAVGRAGARVEATFFQVQEALRSTLKRIHGVLDPKQRARLAELVEQGPRTWHRGGPYRSADL